MNVSTLPRPDNPPSDLERRALDAYRAAVADAAEAQRQAEQQHRAACLTHFQTLLRDQLDLGGQPVRTDSGDFVTRVGPIQLRLWMRCTSAAPSETATAIVAERICVTCTAQFGWQKLSDAEYSQTPLVELGYWLNATAGVTVCLACKQGGSS
jgi:hypothetical protein